MTAGANLTINPRKSRRLFSAARRQKALRYVRDNRNACNSDDPTQLRFHPLADSPILGVDPGITGAIAALYPDGTILADDIPTVGGSVDVDTLVRRIRELAPRLAIIEKAQAMPRQGVVSVFKYGTAFGALCAVTAICEIPTHLVSPRKWKTHFGLDADKEKSRALAIRLWPGCGYFSRVKDHGRSEAALIARYGVETIATNFATPSGKGEGGRLLPPTTHR